MSTSNRAALDAIRRDLLRTIPDRAKAEIAKAVEKAAREVATNASAIAPRGETGDLGNSVRVEAGADELSRTVVVGGTDQVDYATFIEFGRDGADADPFFWPTFRLLEARRNGQLNRAVNKALKDFAG